MGVPWDSHRGHVRVGWESHGDTKVTWMFDGNPIPVEVPMAIAWKSHGDIINTTPWESHGSPMRISLKSHGRPMVKL